MAVKLRMPTAGSQWLWQKNWDTISATPIRPMKSRVPPAKYQGLTNNGNVYKIKSSFDNLLYKGCEGVSKTLFSYREKRSPAESFFKFR